MSANEKTKVLFIAGNGRSGSTMLDVAVGQLSGFFAVGELRRIWDRGVIENRPCGCGVPFRECGIWQEIFDEAYGGMDTVAPETMVGHRERMTQTKHLIGMWMGRHRSANRGRAADEFVRHLDALYAAVRKVSGCNVIVDASKWPMYAYMLDLIPSVELYVLHLIRDPRACAFSWQRKKIYEEGRYLPRQGALKSSFYWAMWNPSIEHFWKRPGANYMFMPYEQFVSEPQAWMRRIVDFVGEDVAELPFEDSHTITMHKTHAVAGNANRLERGSVTLRLDDEWSRALPTSRRALVSSVLWPLMKRYDYPVF